MILISIEVHCNGKFRLHSDLTARPGMHYARKLMSWKPTIFDFEYL